jgi:hypothetical protein
LKLSISTDAWIVSKCVWGISRKIMYHVKLDGFISSPLDPLYDEM